MKKEFVGYIAFYNKNGLHYTVKVIFFVISQIKIHWFNVSISVFTFLYQNKNEADRWKSAHLFGVDRGGGCQIIIHIASLWTIEVGNVYD